MNENPKEIIKMSRLLTFLGADWVASLLAPASSAACACTDPMRNPREHGAPLVA
jgi:hypothetical protein